MQTAGVLRRADRTAEAVLYVEKALALYERKGTTVLAERTRTALADLRRSDGNPPPLQFT